MARFGIVTPTIGRPTLRRCRESIELQVFKDFFHIVVGDGPQDERTKQLGGEHYYEAPGPEGKLCFGAAPRNLALELIENDPRYACDYVVFLDDDNVLLEPALYQINIAAATNANPKLLYQDIVFTSKFHDFYEILPRFPDQIVDGRIQNGDFDLLNGIYRTDVIRGIRFKRDYTNDLWFALDVLERLEAQKLPTEKIGWHKVKGIGGIHHVSWDRLDG